MTDDDVNGTDDSDTDAEVEGTDDTTVDAPRRSRMALGISLVVALVVAGFIGVLATREPSTDRAVHSALIDKAVPAVTGKTLDGDTFNIDNHTGRWVVVNFFATWCRECALEHPQLDAFQKEHEELNDATVVSVLYSDDADKALDYFERQGGDWPVVLDDSNIATQFGVTGVPETYLVDPNGYVRAKLVGGVTQGGLNRYIAQLSDQAAAP
jgi:cytochrome c biogenesis protein CcmG/thiol:disulfide interchange protein DsbE